MNSFRPVSTIRYRIKNRSLVELTPMNEVLPQPNNEESSALDEISPEPSVPKKLTWKEKLKVEAIEVGTVMGYLAVAFCILQTFRCTTLLVSSARNDFLTSYATALVSSVALGKFVFVLEKLPLARRFETKPLIYPVLYKTVLFTALVNVIMHFEERFLHKSSAPAANPETFWPCFFAHQLAFFVTFLVFFAFRDIGRVIGQERLRKLFFVSRDA